LDVGFFEDDKILAISGEFAVKGEIIVLRLLCEIYRNGYFVDYSGLLKNKLARLGGLSGGLVDEVVGRLVEYGFFEESLFREHNILTSRAIQSRYADAAKRRQNCTSLPFWLPKGVNVDINPPLTGVNVDINPQSKLNETKLNKNPPLPPQIIFDSDSEEPDPCANDPPESKPTSALSAEMGKSTNESETSQRGAVLGGTDDEDENDSPFEMLKKYWNIKAEKSTYVKMTPITALVASPYIARELMCRIEEYGDESILCAIDYIAYADWWHENNKTLGITSFLKDTIFPKFLNREYQTKKRGDR